jgi:hypothetical protein
MGFDRGLECLERVARFLDLFCNQLVLCWRYFRRGEQYP